MSLAIAEPDRPLADDHAGHLLRHWRSARRLSQAELADRAQVSPRHLSCVETGRANPSPELLISLGIALDMPLRERNRLLLAAGHAPRYKDRSLDSAELRAVRDTLRRVIDTHLPHPGLVLDRQWNVLMANEAALGLARLLPAFLTQPVMNVFRASLHPQGLAAHMANFAEFASAMLVSLRRAIAVSGDLELMALEAEILAWPNVRALHAAGPLPPAGAAPMVIPCVLDLPTGRVAWFTTISVFGTPQEVLLDEISIELFYPL